MDSSSNAIVSLAIGVTKLPLKLREVLLLHYDQGLKGSEIADTFISQSSVSCNE